MNADALSTALVEWVRETFKQGLVLTADIARYMESVFGTRDLDAVLSDETRDSEIDSLLELLCFPDRPLQLRFESRWGHCTFKAQDLAAIESRLSREMLGTRILSPTGILLATVDMPPFALLSFIRRLNITWQPPLGIAAVLGRHHPSDRGLAVRVHLRNARLAWHRDQVNLLMLYLEKMPPDAEQFENGLVFLLSIVPEMAPDVNGYDFLVAKKFFYFRSLCRAEDFERKRRSSNMEIMILQGVRAAHGSIDEWRQNMRMIDLICQALFGRTQFFQQPGEHCLDIENSDTDHQVETVMRLLS